MHYPYDAFLRNTGLSVNFMTLHWHSNASAFNRMLIRWGATAGNSCTRSFLVKSFNIGVLLSFLLLPIGIILLIITIFNGSETGTSGGAAAAATASVQLEILLPGVNLPLQEIGYYIATLVMCTLLHELGHALAAVLEDVPVTGFGFKVSLARPDRLANKMILTAVALLLPAPGLHGAVARSSQWLALDSQAAHTLRRHLEQFCARLHLLYAHLNAGHNHVTLLCMQRTCNRYRADGKVAVARRAWPTAGECDHPAERLSHQQRG